MSARSRLRIPTVSPRRGDLLIRTEDTSAGSTFVIVDPVTKRRIGQVYATVDAAFVRAAYFAAADNVAIWQEDARLKRPTLLQPRRGADTRN